MPGHAYADFPSRSGANGCSDFSGPRSGEDLSILFRLVLQVPLEAELTGDIAARSLRPRGRESPADMLHSHVETVTLRDARERLDDPTAHLGIGGHRPTKLDAHDLFLD